MDFDDRAALDAGLASDAMRAAGRNLREIAPGLATLLVLESAGELRPRRLALTACRDPAQGSVAAPVL